MLQSVTKAIRYGGWFVGLLLALVMSWIIPEAYVVKPGSCSAGRRYVLFRYKEMRFDPFCSYLLNETDSTLVLFRTDFYNGQYVDVTDPEKFESVGPGALIKFDRYIDHIFTRTYESGPAYVPKYRKNKQTTELTLTYRQEALDETKKIRERIDNRYRIIDSGQRDSLGIPFDARKYMLDRIKEKRDAKKRTDRK
ncbi:MAG: hypothetical protein NC336_07030 [Clostridium sp.]|nr:hypothetical protein [Clostridium sp.]